MQHNQWGHWCIKAQLFFLFIIGIWGAYYFMPLHYDGSAWAFEIYNDQKFHFHFGYFRYSTAVPQLLAVLLSQTSWAHLANLCLSYSYFAFPFITLFFIFKASVNRQRSDVFVLCASLFFLCYLPSSVFGVAIAGEAIAIFSAFLCYLLLSPSPKIKWITFFCIFLLLSYEPSFILYPLCAYFLYREGKLQKIHLLIFAFFTIVQIINLTFLIVPDNSHQFFKVSLSQLSNSPFLLLCFSFCLFLLSKILGLKFLTYFSLLLLTISALISFQRIPTHMWLQTYHDRIWSIPATLGVSVLFYEAFLRKRHLLIPKNLFLIGLFCLPLTIHQTYLTFNHFYLVKRIEAQMKTHSGCKTLRRADFHQEIGQGTFIAPWTLPYFSILLNRSKKISQLLFVENLDQNGQPQTADFCLPIDAHLRHMTDFTHLIIHMDRHYDFTPIYPELE